MSFKVIEGFEQYSVNDKGDILGKRGSLLKPQLNQDGYYQIHLYDSSGVRSLKRINRLVAEAYLPNDTELPHVDHLDGVRTNNCVTNLEWVTEKENKVRGVSDRPELHKAKAKAKITYEQVHQICRYIEGGSRNCDIVKAMGDVSLDIIKHIRNGDTWLDVSKDYSLTRSVRAISDKTVTWVCTMILSGKKNKEIMAETICPNLKNHTIKSIRAKASHKHITLKLLK